MRLELQTKLDQVWLTEPHVNDLWRVSNSNDQRITSCQPVPLGLESFYGQTKHTDQKLVAQTANQEFQQEFGWQKSYRKYCGSQESTSMYHTVPPSGD